MPTFNGQEYEQVGPCLRCGQQMGFFMLRVCDPCLDETEDNITPQERADGMERAKTSKFGPQVLSD